MNETFLEAGKRGKNTWSRYLLGVVFILFMWFVVGGRASLALGSLLDVSAEQIAKMPSSPGLIAGYLVLSASFPFFLLGTLLAVALIHRRNPLTLVTGRRSIDWRRVGTGFGVLFVLVASSTFVEFLVYPSSFSLGPSLAAFVPFALLALVLTPIQTASEDLFFRGYLVQASSLISSNFLFLAVISGVLSMLPHLLANPEVDAGFVLVALYYFGFGAFIAWVSLRDGTLELAIGAHAANNLYGAIVISFEGSALNTPSLFYTDRFVPAYNLIQFLVAAVLFYLAVFVLFKRHLKRPIVHPLPTPKGLRGRVKPSLKSRRKRVHDMTQRKAETVLDFETLCLGIERCDADLLLGFYADDALVSIVNADVPLGPPFELRGKAEIAKHLRAAFGQEASHRVERQEIVREGDGVRFQEVCEYPDGNRIVVETTLEVREGKIFRQVDVVARNAPADSEEENGRNLPDRKNQARTRPRADATPTDRLPHFEQATEEKDFG